MVDVLPGDESSECSTVDAKALKEQWEKDCEELARFTGVDHITKKCFEDLENGKELYEETAAEVEMKELKELRERELQERQKPEQPAKRPE